jgi:hypothetical protein
MTELLQHPQPPAGVIEKLMAAPTVHIAPGMIVTQDGEVCGDLGPEAAGAILMLQATFTDETKAAAFWEAAFPLLELSGRHPGFIRAFRFAAGPTITMFVLWKTLGDAEAFGASAEHRAAVRDLYKHRWQYSHFARLWEVASEHDRVVFCDRCEGITPVSQGACVSCGVTLLDPFSPSSPAGER